MSTTQNANTGTITFQATLNRKMFEKQYDGERWWRVYLMNASKNLIPDDGINYSVVKIFGYIPELNYDEKYTIIAQPEENSKYGISYRVFHIGQEYNGNYSSKDVAIFLNSVIPSYAVTLLSAYPDILDRIVRDEPIDYSKTRGIKEKAYEKIKKRVLSNLREMDFIVAFGDIMSASLIARIYELYPSVDEAKTALANDPYKFFCSVQRIGFIKADKLIKQIARIDNNQYGISRDIINSGSRCLSCMRYLLEKARDGGNTYIEVKDLRQEVAELCPECVDKFNTCISDDSLYFNPKMMAVSLQEVFDIEKGIADIILDVIKKPFFYNKIDLSLYKNIDGVELTDEQIQFLDMVTKNNISILNGCAGTGKSFTIKALIKMLNDNNLSYFLLAPTGKAAKVITDYTNDEAMTIHRWLAIRERYDSILNYADVIIVDEFSMVDIIICYRLLKQIDFSRTKLVIIGDNAQLLSVSCGNLLHEFINTNIIPRVSLSKVFRYADGGLMMVATDVRNGKDFFGSAKEPILIYGNDYRFIKTSKDNIVNNAVALYKKLIGSGVKPYDIELLSAQKVGDCGTEAINSRLQQEINPYYNTEHGIKIFEHEYYISDIVIQTVNNYRVRTVKYNNEENQYYIDQEDMFIANGEIGEIVDIRDRHVYIKFNDEIAEYTEGDMRDVQLGYAITVHKSQGSSAKYVIFISPESHTFMLSSNLIYVALTRTIKTCFHFGDERAVKRAIKKVENIKRQTFMHDLLLGTI